LGAGFKTEAGFGGRLKMEAGFLNTFETGAGFLSLLNYFAKIKQNLLRVKV